MKIAIDLRPLQSGHQHRGIGKYIANVVPALFKVGKQHEFYCYHYGDTPPKLSYVSPSVKFISLGNYDPGSFSSKLYRKLFMHQPGLKESVETDVFFQPDIGFGLSKNTPTVVTLYDLIPIIYREKYFVPRKKPSFLRPFWNMRNEQVFQQFMRLNARFALVDRIVSISQASIDDLHKVFPNTTHVPYLVTPLAAQKLPVPSKRKINNKPYMLYVGGTDSRKNLIKLVDMYEGALNGGIDVDLVLIGYDFEQPKFYDTARLLKHIDKSPVKKRIRVVGYADDAKLATYYSQAQALLFASEYEGFGMPILEAMQAGCPVICFNNSSIPEVAGNAAIMVDTEAAFIDSIVQLAKSEKLRKELIQKGKKQVAGFTWENAAELTLKALEGSAKAKN